MKLHLLIIVFLLAASSFGQTKTYTSLLTEYKMGQEVHVPYEWIKRKIRISTDTITIISYGKEGTDFQNWKINSKTEDLEGILFYTHLVRSSENDPLPAIFKIVNNDDNKADVIIWKIPEDLENMTREVWLYIDYKY